MKRRGDLAEESDLLRHTVFQNFEFFLAEIGYVEAAAIGCDYRDGDEIGVGLECLDVFRFGRWRRRWLRQRLSLAAWLRLSEDGSQRKRDHQKNGKGMTRRRRKHSFPPNANPSTEL